MLSVAPDDWTTGRAGFFVTSTRRSRSLEKGKLMQRTDRSRSIDCSSTRAATAGCATPRTSRYARTASARKLAQKVACMMYDLQKLWATRRPEATHSRGARCLAKPRDRISPKPPTTTRRSSECCLFRVCLSCLSDRSVYQILCRFEKVSS